MRHIGREELETLKNGVDLVALVQANGTPLKRVGSVFRGHCPFPGHDDETPSFTVNPKTNTYRCFGACPLERQTGDAIAFVRHLKGITFQQALDDLFPGLGILVGNGNGHGAQHPATPSLLKGKTSSVSKEKELGEQSASSLSKDNSLSLLKEVDASLIVEKNSSLSKEEDELQRARLLDLVVGHYETTLAHSTPAQRYLDKRGLLVPDMLKRLRVGFSDGSLVDAIAPDGEQQKRLTAIGLLSDGRDVFSNKIVVPLLDAKTGAVLSLYGRTITGSRHFYLSGARRGLVNGAAAMAVDDLVVVESIFDAMSLLVLGIANVVPIYGTNGWTRDHDRLLSDGTARTVRLLLDSDDAGRKASASFAEELTKRGIVVHVASLPAPHKDPNDALVAGVTREQLRDVLGVEYTPAAEQPLPAENPAVISFEREEHGAPALHVVRPASSPSLPTRPPARYDLEDIAEGFRLTIGSRRYWARAVRGGGYVRLEMTLRLEDGVNEHVDRLDLYNGRARRSFALRAARRFGFDDETIERELVLLTQQGEEYVATRSESESASDRPKAPELSDAEKAEALALLKEPTLLDITVGHLTRLGYVGEDTNKALGYLIIVSRKLEDPLSALVLSQSAAGKSGLTELLEKVTPPEDVEFFSRLTPAALYYMERDRLCRKVVIIEERPGSEEADYSIRTLQSRKKLVLGVPIKDPRTGKTETKTKEVDGPAVFLQTTTAIEVNYENSTRCFELYLDESAEQTRRIHAYQRRLTTLDGQHEAAESAKLVKLHWNAQRMLRRLRVVIPYAELLTFPETWLRTRRDQERFLNLIKASAFLYQYQRRSPEGVDTVVEAAVDDYAVAYKLAATVLGATLSDVKKPAQELLHEMKAFTVELAGKDGRDPERVLLSRRQVRERTGLPDHQVRRLMSDLVQLEHLEQTRGSQGSACLYRVPANAGEPERALQGLLSPEELAKRVQEPTLKQA